MDILDITGQREKIYRDFLDKLNHIPNLTPREYDLGLRSFRAGITALNNALMGCVGDESIEIYTPEGRFIIMREIYGIKT